MGWSLLVSFVAIEVLIDRPDVKTFHFVSCGTSGSCQAAVGALKVNEIIEWSIAETGLFLPRQDSEALWRSW